MKFNVVTRSTNNPQQKESPKPIIKQQSNNSRTKIFDILKSVGFQHKDTNDITMMKLPSSDALYIRLSNREIKVLLWCMEENYVHREIKYSDCIIDDTMNVGQIILYFLNNKQ